MASAPKDRFDEFDFRNSAKKGIKRELDSLDILLLGRVSRTALTLEQYIDFRIAQGASLDVIEQDLLTDLNEGGRIFGEFRNAIKPTFNGSLGRFSDVGKMTEFIATQQWRWIAILVNTCPDCLDRHGVTKTMQEWEEEGLPKAGATVCGENCKCILLPAEVAELAPIQRGK